MPKSKQKQKQKQSQVTKVTVRVGDTNKSKKRVSRPQPSRASVARQPSSISVTLQGSSLSVPNPPTQQYNELVQQVEALRRQMALSGSLIPRAATNDIFNRVQATNPFANISTAIPMATLIRPESVPEEMVEGATTQDAFIDGNSAEIPINQDWIRNVALANKAQSLGAVSKIGVVEDPETFQDIDDYDRQQEYNYKALERAAAREKLKEKQELLQQRMAIERFKESEERNIMMGEDIISQNLPFEITPKKARGRPRKLGKG